MRKTTVLALFVVFASLACKREAEGKTPPAPPAPPPAAKPTPELSDIPAPADVAAAPADAEKTASGLAARGFNGGNGFAHSAA